MKSFALLVGVCLLTSCGDKKPDVVSDQDTITTNMAPVAKNNQQLHTDTLQYIHFEGNFDYWYAVFINQRRDTVQFVVDAEPPARLRNKLVKVSWFADTLSEAGDNESKYASKRLKDIREINEKLFAAPVTEDKVLKDIRALPEVNANADQVGIAERPTNEKEYYLVETGTRDEDKFSRLFMFRVYIYPVYEIKYYDFGQDIEMSLDNWRKTKS